MTGKHQTKLRHEWDELPLVSQIIPVLEDHVLSCGANDKGDFQNLAATLFMVWRDAKSFGRCWLRTLEQVDGGAPPGPWLQLRSRGEVKAFLIDYAIFHGEQVQSREVSPDVGGSMLDSTACSN